MTIFFFLNIAFCYFPKTELCCYYHRPHQGNISSYGRRRRRREVEDPASMGRREVEDPAIMVANAMRIVDTFPFSDKKVAPNHNQTTATLFPATLVWISLILAQVNFLISFSKYNFFYSLT